MPTRYPLDFGHGRSASAVDLFVADELPDALCVLGYASRQPVVVLVGGADGLGERPARLLYRLFADTLVSRLDLLGAAVMDGGTEAGIMALMGRARSKVSANFPLIGVAARGTVALPTEQRDGSRSLLEPNHTHFLLVPGNRWGDESPWISDAASVLAGGMASATLVAGGGEITRLDVEQSLRARRPTLLLAGSGGTADRLADALCGDAIPALGIPKDQVSLLQVLDLTTADRELPGLLRTLFAD